MLVFSENVANSLNELSQTGLIAIRGNSTLYTISRKDYHSWACSARNIFNFTAPLIAENRRVN